MKFKLLLSVFFAAIIGFCSFAVFADDSFTPAQTKAIEDIVKNYLLNNPEVIAASLNNLQQKKLAEMEKEWDTLSNKYAKEIFTPGNNPVLGNPKGNIVMAEFFDYQCPHCKLMGNDIAGLIKANPDLKVILVELPIYGEDSIFASKASLASGAQGKLDAFHLALLNNKGNTLPKNDVLSIAKSVGIDVDKLQKDMQNSAFDKQLNKNQDLAGKLKLIGTPSFVVGTTSGKNISFLAGQVEKSVVQKAIDDAKK